jgi:ATP phosphoribosyltransferase regulatory subunit
VFDGQSPEVADAEVFATIHAALPDLKLRATVGDIGILLEAVRGLSTSAERKRALIRHLWRPRKFRALLDRFSKPTPARQFNEVTGPDIGLRTKEEVAERIALLQADARAYPLPPAETAKIDALLNMHGALPAAVAKLERLAHVAPSTAYILNKMIKRLDELSARGVDLNTLTFEGSYGRTTLEYYDGFVFGLSSESQPDLPPIATGGRYDALTRALGRGRHGPAVGGVIRPELVVALRGMP